MHQSIFHPSNAWFPDGEPHPFCLLGTQEGYTGVTQAVFVGLPILMADFGWILPGQGGKKQITVFKWEGLDRQGVLCCSDVCFSTAICCNCCCGFVLWPCLFFFFCLIKAILCLVGPQGLLAGVCWLPRSRIPPRALL